MDGRGGEGRGEQERRQSPDWKEKTQLSRVGAPSLPLARQARALSKPARPRQRRPPILARPPGRIPRFARARIRGERSYRPPAPPVPLFSLESLLRRTRGFAPPPARPQEKKTWRRAKERGGARGFPQPLRERGQEGGPSRGAAAPPRPAPFRLSARRAASRPRASLSLDEIAGAPATGLRERAPSAQCGGRAGRSGDGATGEGRQPLELQTGKGSRRGRAWFLSLVFASDGSRPPLAHPTRLPTDKKHSNLPPPPPPSLPPAPPNNTHPHPS